MPLPVVLISTMNKVGTANIASWSSIMLTQAKLSYLNIFKTLIQSRRVMKFISFCWVSPCMQKWNGILEALKSLR